MSILIRDDGRSSTDSGWRRRSMLLILVCLILSAMICATPGSAATESTFNQVFFPIPETPAGTVSTTPVDQQDNIPTTSIEKTPDSKTPVIRYSKENLPSDISEYLDYIDFQTKTGTRVNIYFSLPAAVATVNMSEKIADFIMSRKEWIGDRSRESAAAEIYIHWVADNAEPLFQGNTFSKTLFKQYIIGSTDSRQSPVHPTHLGYLYKNLDKKNPMDAFLLTL